MYTNKLDTYNILHKYYNIMLIQIQINWVDNIKLLNRYFSISLTSGQKPTEKKCTKTCNQEKVKLI